MLGRKKSTELETERNPRASSWIPFFLQRIVMAKNKKGYQEYLNYRKAKGLPQSLDVADYDFKGLAEEFQKLLKKRFLIKLSDGNTIDLVFREGNFYHLLGFHKFKKTLFYTLIKNETISYSATDFYKDVLESNITFASCNYDKISFPENIDVNEYVFFSEHEQTGEVKDILMRRFPYFSYENIIKLLSSKVAINFEKDSHEGDINASKIFFYYLDITQRNLNLFLNNDDNGFYSTSFFLENTRDYYKTKTDGTPMELQDVLSLYIIDMESHSEIDFRVDWNIVTDYVLGLDAFSAYYEMKKFYNNKDITLNYIKEQYKELQAKRTELDNDLQILEVEYEIESLKEKYMKSTIEDAKESIQLELMDYNIDVDEDMMDLPTVKKKLKNLNSIKREATVKRKRLDKKISKIQNAFLEIRLLDIRKIKEVYIPLIENSMYWKNEFWEFLEDNYDVLNEQYTPRRIKELYQSWKTAC